MSDYWFAYHLDRKGMLFNFNGHTSDDTARAAVDAWSGTLGL